MNAKQPPWALAMATGTALLSPLLGLDMLLEGGYHDTQRGLQLAVLGAVALLSLQQLHTGAVRWPGMATPSLWLGLLAGALGGLSSILAAFPAQAAFELGMFFFLFLTAWRIAAEVAPASSVRIPQALAWVVAGSLLYGFKALLVYVIALMIGGQPHPANLIHGFDNYRFLNHGQTVTLPLLGLFICLVPGADVRNRRWRAAGWVALVLWWMLLFMTAGRGTLIAVVVAMSVVGFWRQSLAWPWVRTMGLGAVVGLLAYGVLYVGVPICLGLEPFGFLGHVVQRSFDNPGSSRWALWTCAVQMVVQHPWLGAGPLHYAQACAPLGIAAHPHNWVLQVAAEWGLLALVCLCAVLAMAGRALYRCGAALDAKDERGQAVLTCWLATGCAVALDGLVSGLVVMPVSQLWIAVYAGLAWGWVRAVRPPSGGPPVAASLPWRCFAGGMILAAAGLLTVGVAATLASAHSAESEGLRLAPRAWGSGFFGVLR